MNDSFDLENFIRQYYKLNRAPVTDDINFFVEGIKKILPGGEILKSKSGEECLTWITPPSWNVKCGILQDDNGKTIIDFINNPLHLMQYSSSFEGKIDFDELDKHLYYSKEHPNDITFINRKQYKFRRDDSWGISIPYNIYKNLDHKSKYYVNIDVEFSNKEMLVYHLNLPGETDDTIFFAAHSCHPAQVNDGIACIALLIKLFKWIATLQNRKNSYRLIIGPEYFAATFYLKNQERIKNLRYGFFLDMMVHAGKIGFSSSFQSNTLVDFVTDNCVKNLFRDYEKYRYRGLWGNDEMFYDGPDFRIPTIGLGRTNFSNYHLSSDDPNTIDKKSVEDSWNLLKDIVLTFENTEFINKNFHPPSKTKQVGTDNKEGRIIKRNYLGPLYLSRYGLYIDPKKDRPGYRNLQNIQILMDGKKSNNEIAKQLDIDINFVENFSNKLIENNLAEEIAR